MDETEPTLALSDYLTVAEAARFLGVSVSTLRNWDRAAKLRPRRHPLNGYRLYDRRELAEMLGDLRAKKGGPNHGD